MINLNLFGKGNKSADNNVKPVYERERYRCPFYGFFGGLRFGVLMDQDGNQCALITDSYSPCQMGIRGQTPNWDKCTFNTEENKALEEIADSLRVCAKEFWPEGTKSWKGLPFRAWQRYVMSQSEK